MGNPILFLNFGGGGYKTVFFLILESQINGKRPWEFGSVNGSQRNLDIEFL